MDINEIIIGLFYKWNEKTVTVIDKRDGVVLVGEEMTGETYTVNPDYLNLIPPVELEGSEEYWDYWAKGGDLAKRFPEQDADELMYAFEYAIEDWVKKLGLEKEVQFLQWCTNIVCVNHGERDEDDWVWALCMKDPKKGYYSADYYVVKAWCDYTGWDCRSGGFIMKVAEK